MDTECIDPAFIIFLIPMIFVIFEESIFLFSMVFNVLVIQGGLRGTNLLVPLGTKFVMMFNKFSLNVLTCQLGSVLMLRC